MEPIEYNVYGIKCDNKECDYSDMDIKFEDYPDWVNKPCPRCGANLLTEEDLRSTKMLVEIIKDANKMVKDLNIDTSGSKVKVGVDMDGSGAINFRDIRSVEESN